MLKLKSTILLTSLTVVTFCSANVSYGEENSLSKKQIEVLTDIFKISNTIKSDANRIMDCIRDTTLEAIVYESSGEDLKGKTGVERGLSFRKEAIEIQNDVNLALRDVSHIAYALMEASAATAHPQNQPQKINSFTNFKWLNERLQFEYESSTVLLEGIKGEVKKQFHEFFFEHPVCGESDGVEGVTVETFENNMKINTAKIKELVKQL